MYIPPQTGQPQLSFSSREQLKGSEGHCTLQDPIQKSYAITILKIPVKHHTLW